MNRFKNMAKIIICAFAIFGMTACGGSSASNNGGTDGLTVTSATNVITDNEINFNGDNFTFVLRFTDDVSVDTLVKGNFLLLVAILT